VPIITALGRSLPERKLLISTVSVINQRGPNAAGTGTRRPPFGSGITMIEFNWLAGGYLTRVQRLHVRWTFTGLLWSPATSVIHTCTSLWLWLEVPQPRLNG